MARRRVILPRARRDLDLIWSYIADDSEKAADATISRITETFAMLTENPRAGRQRYDVSANLRSFVVERYMIFYADRSDRIEIVRVMHGKRDVSRKDLT